MAALKMQILFSEIIFISRPKGLTQLKRCSPRIPNLQFSSIFDVGIWEDSEIRISERLYVPNKIATDAYGIVCTMQCKSRDHSIYFFHFWFHDFYKKKLWDSELVIRYSDCPLR